MPVSRPKFIPRTFHSARRRLGQPEWPRLSFQHHSWVGACGRNSSTVAVRLHQAAAPCLDNGNRLFVELVDPFAGDAFAEKRPRVGGAARAPPGHCFKAREML